jgi:hypothetical protein
MRQIYAPDFADIADVLNRLAYITMQRNAVEADALYREATTFDRNRSAAAPVFVSDGLHFLAWAQHRKGDLRSAEATYRRALSMYRRRLPNGHAYRAAAATGLGSVLIDAGQPSAAEPFLREGMTAWQRNAAPDSALMAEARDLLSRVAGNR